MILNHLTSDSANEIAREIAKGSRFTVLRQPMEKHPKKWAEKLELLCQRVDQLEDRFERGDCLEQTLLERAQSRLDKVAAQIPKKWIFKSEGQKKTEKAQSVIRGLLAPDAQEKRYARLQKTTHKESGIFIPKISSVAAAICFLFANGVGARPVTPKGATDLQRFSPSCDYTPEEAVPLRADVQRSVQESRLVPIEGASSGVYIAHETDHSKLAIVKPVDERNRGPQNKKAARREDDLSEEDQHQLNSYPGNPEKRQFVARRLDFGSVACQPPGYIDEMDSDQFFSVDAEKAGHPAGVQRKKVYVQQFVSDATPLVELHPDFPQDPTKAYKIESNPVLDQVPLEEFQKVALLDLLLYNEDRHPGNLLISKDAAGKPHLIPIDMDMILPGTFQKAPWIGLFTHRRAEERLTPEALAWIEALNPEQVASVIREEGLADPLVRQGKMLALVLKKLGSDHSIAEISQFIFSKLPHLAELSRKNALKELTPSDRENYQKSESLRKTLWEKRGISSEDETWYKAYQADNAKQKIETLLEETTFAYFERGLQREAAAAKARKTRHITFGTTYVAGNADRDALSKLVSDNQQEYAQHWSLNGKVVTESLLEGQCQGLTCVPYWNKVAILKEWLEQPSSGKEEWYILADDDMPITNMNINPYEAIDLLREGHDASIIIAKDVVQWKGGNRDHSVNTGVLIVRRDQNSKAFIEKLWAKRNDAASDSPHCLTLGTCKTQDVLHEQEAFARVLEEDPSLLNKVVKVVNYRDQYQGREIAINTFRRHGCFIRTQDGWKDKPFSFNDPTDGAWQEGDWMGQTAGVPIIGKECKTGVSRFFRLDYLHWMLERIVPIDTDVSSFRRNQPVRAPEAAAESAAVSGLAHDQELLYKIQTLLTRKGDRDPNRTCGVFYGYWPRDCETLVQETLAKIADSDTKAKAQFSIDEAWAKYIFDQKFGNEGKPYLSKIKNAGTQGAARGYIDRVLLSQISSLGKERRFEEATQRVSDIHSATTQEEATRSIATDRLAYDQELLQKIQTLLIRKGDGDPDRTCGVFYGYWPRDCGALVQETLAKIADPETQIKAQLSIDEAWAKLILDRTFGNEGKPYLSKIKDAAIQEKARGYIDQVLLRQISSLGKERRFEEATQRVSDIHSATTQEEATRSIATDRLAYDQELLQKIQTLLERKGDKDPDRTCGALYGYWPRDCEALVQKTLAKIADPETQIKAQLSIDEAWAKHILDRTFGNEGKPYLSKIKDAAIQEKAHGYIDQVLLRQISSLGKERRFKEATQRVSDIHSATTQEEATRSIATDRLAYDQELLQKIQTLLERKGDKDPDRTCGALYGYWPRDCEALVQKTLAKIADPETQIKAQLSIDEAWAKHILDRTFGNEGKPYLSKIKDAAIQEKAHGYIDQVLLRQISSLGKERRFKEATQRVSDIHSATTQEEATRSIATDRLAYDQELLQKIQTLLERKGDKDPDRTCGALYGYWPRDCEALVQKTLAKIVDPETQIKAQHAIGKAWTKYILDHNLEHDKDTHLAKIADKTICSIAREGLEKMAVEKVKTLTQKKNFEEAGKVISQIQSASIRKEAEQILDASLFERIKHLLTKTKYNPKYDASKSSDCRGCYWPEDLEQTIEKMVTQISDTDVKKQARKSIDLAWIQHNKLGDSTTRCELIN